jgi:ATP-dependent DNA ligase
VAFQRRKSEPIGVKAPLPGFVEPGLASWIAKVPSGSRWIHEIKFDGYRVQATWPTRRSRSSPAAATTGRTASRRSPTTPGTSRPLRR